MLFKSNTVLLFILMFLLLSSFGKVTGQEDLPAISLKDARLDDVVRMLAEKAQINLVLTKEIDKKVTLQLKDSIPPLQLLHIVCNEHGYSLVKKDNIYILEEKKKEVAGKQEGTLEAQAVETKEAAEKNYFQLTRKSIDQVQNEIQQLLSPQGTIKINREANAVMVLDKTENVLKVKDYIEFLNLDPVSAVEILLQERTFKIDRMNADTLEDSIKSMLTPDKGKITFDKKTMTLVVVDKEDVLNKIDAFLKIADRPEPQVYIRCHMIEVNLDANTQAGFDFKSDGWKLDDLISDPAATGAKQGFSLIGPSDKMNVGFRSPHDDFAVNFSSIASRNNVRVLSSPNLLCANKKTSKIEVTQELPYITTTTDPDTNATTVTVNFKEAGIKLEVTPDIYSDKNVNLLLKAEVSSNIKDFPYNTSGQPTQFIPTIKKKLVESNVLAKDRQTIVIGGILEDSIQKIRTKVPLLGDIPLLGLLFSNEDQKMVKTELLIFMNISIVNEEYLDNMAKHEWKAQQEKFDKFDTEFEFYPHLKQKLDIDKLNPDYEKK